MKDGSLNEASKGSGAANGHCQEMRTRWAEKDPGKTLLPQAFMRQEGAANYRDGVS